MMRGGKPVVLTVLLAVLVLGCREERLAFARGVLELPQPRVEFPATYLGKQREAALRLVNAGRGALVLSWGTVPQPFSVAELPTRVEAGDVEVRFQFTPTALGVSRVDLPLVVEGGGSYTITLDGEGVPVPICGLPLNCHQATFDLATERCVESVLPDGTACDPHNDCVVEATCQAGVCRGRERSCNDDNLCTVDVCNPLDGCGSVPAPPCPGDGACREGVCDPKLGCLTRAAPDGSSCGERGCGDVEVCIDGACVERPAPEGYVCAPATPCRAEGRCVSSVCVQPPARALQASWTYDADGTAEDLHDIIVSPEGDLTLSGFFGYPVLSADSAAPVITPYPARRCMLWNARLLCMDSPASAQVSLLDRRTGRPRWSLDLVKERRDLTEQSSNVFLARLAVMAPDRLAAIFEGYPAGVTNQDTQCRVYFLVVMDAGGGLVSAQRLQDPLLDVCNHPHPFGLAADTRGDLYIAFSPTESRTAPLAPASPTLLYAFDTDGVQRWKRTVPVMGGELVTVQGLLFSEALPEALRTSDGTTAASVPSPLRAVASNERFIAGPASVFNRVGGLSDSPEALRVQAFRLPDLATSWRFQLPSDLRFVSKELRMARWKAGPNERAETTVLGWAAQASLSSSLAPLLVGIRERDGAEAFRCELEARPTTPPQLMELGPQKLFTMWDAETCGDCDPPFARSRATFSRYDLPGLTPAEAPWPGTFGGPGHDHREDRIYAPPTPPQ